MVKLPPHIVNCVGFVGSRRQDGRTFLRGTAFFLVRRIPGVAEDLSLCFAVTARHVLDGIRRTGEQGCLRVSLRTGGVQWIDFDLGDWIEHSDTTVDAAVFRMKTVHIFDIGWIPASMILTEKVLEDDAIGVGDEVFITGLFVNRPGRDRNIPIVRVGNIAAMPVERVSSPAFGEMDAFLIEARSIGGLSGSPAFVHLGIVRLKETEAPGRPRAIWANNPGGVFYWMGLVHGHYDGNLFDVDEPGRDENRTQRERVNMGIAIVVPATRIVEIFEERRLKEYEEAGSRAAKARTTSTQNSIEMPSGEESLTESDFMEALDKVSRHSGAPQTSDEK